ncbi:IS66 family transposase [Clostridium kluyveri]|uniref:Transposase IS66 central domain-containing protein n=1 Tax=Clostridium kluyveri TaxID=1534 RepID=A0A1L5FCS2_CLOKL|nr:transposase [Clostridium kluyveri]APM40808.1 hypothetical protein BS101_19890 [Clostridium kluyveri]
MKDKLLESNYVQADETTVVVVDAKGNDSKAKKYMWLYKTGASENPVILYDYRLENNIKDNYYAKRYETRVEKISSNHRRFYKICGYRNS